MKNIRSAQTSADVGAGSRRGPCERLPGAGAGSQWRPRVHFSLWRPANTCIRCRRLLCARAPIDWSAAAGAARRHIAPAPRPPELRPAPAMYGNQQRRRRARDAPAHLGRADFREALEAKSGSATRALQSNWPLNFESGSVCLLHASRRAANSSICVWAASATRHQCYQCRC